ncbi:MAG: hypothetical protein ACRDD1_03045 [Planctomycetia bacterium]
MTRILFAFGLSAFLLAYSMDAAVAQEAKPAAKSSEKAAEKPAAEKTAPADEKATTKEDAKKRAFNGRLPNGWTKLGLTEEQIKKIYAAQMKSKDSIDKSKTDEAKLRADLRKEIEELLTPEQKTKLAEVEAEAAAKRKAAKEKKKADEKPAAKTEEKPEAKKS